MVTPAWQERFQSTLPVWGATGGGGVAGRRGTISIHAPRVGSDHDQFGQKHPIPKFQSTLPVWGATLLVGVSGALYIKISIHAPRVGSDQEIPHGISRYQQFQSTLPVWGATLVCRVAFPDLVISIHAPRVGSDYYRYLTHQDNPEFQSTLPVWGATGWGGVQLWEVVISIHAPRVGSDGLPLQQRWRRSNFNPRSPCGERLLRSIFFDANREFQSTLPVWGATPEFVYAKAKIDISIHAPRVGSDFPLQQLLTQDGYVTPRSPCGERPMPMWLIPCMWLFQSTLPVWGATYPFV